MKTYYLKLTQDDFPLENRSGNNRLYSWRTDNLNLYVNNQYVNFVTRKARYGSLLLGDNTYTGFETIDANTSEIGYVSSGRFIDNTSRVDIGTWTLQDVSTLVEENIKFSLITRTSTEDDQATPGSWESWTYKRSEVGQDVLVINSNKYANFELEIATDPNADISDLEFVIYISVEIDSPAVQGYFSRTLSLLNKFPEWMDIRESVNIDGATPLTAMPESLGGQFLNAVAGEWLTDVASKIQYQQFQYYIDNVDTSQKAWAYRLDNVPPQVIKLSGDGIELARCSTIAEFYDTSDSEDTFYWDFFQKRIYLTHKYVSLTINADPLNEDGLSWVDVQDPYHLWNSLDDIGAAIDLFRLIEEEEKNDSFKKRIIDVYRNKPGVGVEAFKLALRRELNLWLHMDGATPSSDYLGATPTVLEMEDLEKDSRYFYPDGNPKDRFLSLINELAIEYPILWGYLRYGKAFWDPDGLERKGIATIGQRYDATPISEKYLDSGIGDGNDLYLFKPTEYTSPEEFSLDLKIRGRYLNPRIEHVGVEFDISVYGQADFERYNNPRLEANFTIELTTPTGVWYTHVAAAARSDIDAEQLIASSNSHGLVDWVTPDGYTNLFYRFRKKSDDSAFLDTSVTPSSGQIDLATVTAVTLRTGLYDYATQTYPDKPTQSQYKAWFEGQSGTVLGSGGAAVSITKNPYSFATITGNFIFQSLATSSLGVVADGWQSEFHSYHVNLNGELPDYTIKDQIVDLLGFQWPSTSTNREIIVQLDTSSGSEYGAYSDEMSATPIFLPAEYIKLNGNSTWTDGHIKSLPSSTISLTFSTGIGALYPINSPAWELFEAIYSNAVSGTVDSNGPWRNGKPGSYSSTNETLTYLNLSRNDFGIANTTDYIVTWIGISGADNDRVITWLDSNTVKPAVTPSYESSSKELVYSDKVVEEYYDEDEQTYKFTTFPLKCRLSLSANQKWHPKVHSGWFYDDVEEFYLYADPRTISTSSAQIVLPKANKQGAPILVTDESGNVPLRQVHFWDMDGATPVTTLVNTETKNGNGTSTLFAAFTDIYDITVTNKTLNIPMTLSSDSSMTNKIELSTDSSYEHTYIITYKVAGSYLLDNDYLDGSTPTGRITFDSTPSSYGYSNYVITLEGSKYDPATPIPLPLNTLYTDFSEGFIYIDHDTYDLQRIEVKVSPSQIVAGKDDYALVAIESYDIFGNPKPNIQINLYTNFGNLSTGSVTTDRDGCAYATLDSQAWDNATPVDPSPATPALASPVPNGYPQGLILAEASNKTATASFDIYRKRVEKNRITAVMNSDHILADAKSSTSIFGIVLDKERKPVVGQVVYWRKARTVFELFNSHDYTINTAAPGSTRFAGSTTTDSKGRFTVGPFVSSSVSGYWLVACETGGGENLVGDIVYWYEYPDVTIGIDPVTNLPPYPIQHSTPSWELENYTYGSVYPVTVDEEDFEAGESSTPSIQWRPPIWYAIDQYRQYHMGLSALKGYYSNNNSGDGFSFATPAHPHYREM